MPCSCHTRLADVLSVCDNQLDWIYWGLARDKDHWERLARRLGVLNGHSYRKGYLSGS